MKKLKKNVEKTTSEETESTVVSAARSVCPESPEQTINFTTPDSDDGHQLPVLSNVIVQRYEGETCQGQFHGEGVAHFEGGHMYKGMFSQGLMHGRGVYTWTDGVKYEGEFVSNVPMGRGVYTWLDGSSYDGDVYNAIRHGIGTHRDPEAADSDSDPQFYAPDGYDEGTVYYNQDWTSWYKGGWVNNNREGWGVRCYPSGNIYQGEWKDNLRHGEGTMRWLKLGQQYDGTWQNGVQHGQGADTWFLWRVDSSQFQQRNEYRGGFIQGQRHGHGTFYYAGGGMYRGEWKNNKKHGQGKFTFKNRRIFEGEFVDDDATDLGRIETPTPRGRFLQCLPGPDNDPSGLVPDMALVMGSLLEKIPKRRRDAERKQVECVIQRHNAELRSIYSFYSRRGRAPSPDNTFLLSRLQFWRLLKDCNVHRHGITLTQMDRFISADVLTPDIPPEEVHSPFTTMLLYRLVGCLVAVAYRIYHQDTVSPKDILASCFSKLMTDDILPNAKNVKGFVFSDPDRAVVAGGYTERCWEIYQSFCTVNTAPLADRAATHRHLVWLFKDLRLFDEKLTTRRFLEVITAENLDAGNLSNCNLDLEITFLEFFEALLGCAEVKCQQAEMGSDSAALLSDSQVGNQVPALEAKLTSNLPRLPGAELTEESGDEEMEAPESELDQWIQGTHRFFSHFFAAYDHNQSVIREVKEERLRQVAQRRIALAKAQEHARLREHWDERRQKDEEAAEKPDGHDEDVSTSPAIQTPVASNASVTTTAKPSTSAAPTKRK